jgi:formylglycine-generating enzyme required for sulfatase activity
MSRGLWPLIAVLLSLMAPAGSRAVQPTGAARITENSVGMKLVLIAPGEFLMGSPATEEGRSDDEPQHRVRITRPYYLGQYEVTVSQFRRFVKESGYATTIERDGRPGFGFVAAAGVIDASRDFTWRSTGWEQTDDHPVVNVSWEDAASFCRWLSAKEGPEYRLPTEAEWEFACRAGATTRYFTGEAEETLQGAANMSDAAFLAKYANATWSLSWNDGFPFTAPVGRFRPNAFGLYDMAGNAWEWCADWYGKDYTSRSPVDDPPGPATGEIHVLRGGSFTNRLKYVRSADRDSSRPKYRYNFTGFRVAKSADR